MVGNQGRLGRNRMIDYHLVWNEKTVPRHWENNNTSFTSPPSSTNVQENM
jgi:hypothetical protein